MQPEGKAALRQLLASAPELARDPRAELRRIYLSDEIVDDYAEGLRLAGLGAAP